MEAMQFPAKINALAWSPDSRSLAAACADGTVYVRDIDAPDAAGLMALPGHCGQAISVTWSPDGKRVASGGMDRRVQIWNAQTGAQIGAPLEFDNQIAKVQWSPQGHRFLIVAGKRVWVIKEEGPKRANRAGTSRAWMLKREAMPQLSQIPLAHPYTVTDAEWSPDGEFLATTSANLTIQIWDAVEDQWVLSLSQAMGVVRLKWAPDGLRVAVGTNQGNVYIYRPAGGQLMEHYRVSNAPVRDLSWIKLEKACRAMSSIVVIADQQMKVVGQQGEAILLEEPKADRVLAFSPDGKFLAARSQNQAVRIYPCSLIASHVS